MSGRDKAIPTAKRTRRAHRKSPGGCRNCKIRRVKCDESRPMCHKCVAFSVRCNYQGECVPDLEPLSNGPMNNFKIDMPIKSPCSLNRTTLCMINNSLDGTEPILRLQDLDLLRKFQTQSVLTLGSRKGASICSNSMLELAFVHPFLMHAVLKFTSLHERIINKIPLHRQRDAEAFHSARGLSLFNYKLSQPIIASERDAIWAASSIFAAMSFSCDEFDPHDVWPLKTPAASDLSWLMISAGKRAIFEVTNPLRGDSRFRDVMLEVQDVSVPTSLDLSYISALPVDFLDLYAIDENTTEETNPYYPCVSVLAYLIDMQCSQDTLHPFMGFLGAMSQEYKNLVSMKDPRALLLMAYWFAKLSEYKQWWVWSRAQMETQAICLYLRKMHRNNEMIQKLLVFPESTCGLAKYVGVG